MASLNKANIIGNLTKDPTCNMTSSGTSVANFSIATNERVKKNGEWIDHVEYHDVVFFGKTADVCAQYLAKGREVYVEGAIRKEKYTKDGVEKLAVKILGDTLIMLGNKGSKGDAKGGGSGGAPRDSYEEPAFDADSEIPF